VQNIEAKFTNLKNLVFVLRETEIVRILGQKTGVFNCDVEYCICVVRYKNFIGNQHFLPVDGFTKSCKSSSQILM